MSDTEYEQLEDQAPDFDEDFGDKEWPFSDKGGVDEIPVPTGTACGKISAILGRASEHSGDFSFGGQADQLPVVPGMFVDGVGPVPVPLWEERAHRIIEKCTESPFGHNMDTKMDENVRKSWELQPDQVKFKNPLWKAGIEKMAVTIAERLGYKDIPLQCVLYKLLVYGEGGHFLKHQDTEKEDGMIATLIVQPPSLHEGGDLVVYRNGEVKHRHDFGKADGTATYLPHYAVHYADAEHALERVTKGYRLALVYSVCLPVNMRHLERNPNRPMSGELAETIETMASGDDNFALFLVHEYTKHSIAGLGASALKGVDRARFLALDEANNSISAEKKLQFQIVKLYHHVNFYGRFGAIGDWDENGREENVTWYSTRGECLGNGDKVKLKLNFLNPNTETRSQFWQKPYGSSDMHSYTGNEGPTKDSIYSRFAVVAWPELESLEFTCRFISVETAFMALQERVPVGTARLQRLIEIANTKLEDMETYRLEYSRRGYSDQLQPFFLSTCVCQVLCRQLESCGTSRLVNFFFRSMLFSRVTHKGGLASDIAKLVQKFSWADVGKSILDALTSNSENPNAVDDVLAVVNAFDREEPQRDLLALAVKGAVGLKDGRLVSLIPLRELWELILSRGNDAMLYTLSCKFQQMSPRLLNPVIKILSRYLEVGSFPDDKKALFVAIISGRVEWLKDQIRVLEKPFSWTMPVAEFRKSVEIEKFLRGPEETMTTTGIINFGSSWSAQMFCSKHAGYRARATQINASFGMSGGGGERDPFVEITKTRAWYDENQENLPRLKEELGELTKTTVETLLKLLSTKAWARQN